MKDFNLNNLVRENIKALKPYSSARDEYQRYYQEIWSFWMPMKTHLKMVLTVIQIHNKQELKLELSELKNIPKEHILFGNGSDEVLDLIFRAFCEPIQDQVITLATNLWYVLSFGKFKCC